MLLSLIVGFGVVGDHSSTALAQKPATLKGTIRFLTIDEGPEARATVTLEGERNNHVFEITPGMRGAYEFTVPPGIYRIIVKVGFCPTKRAAFRLRESQHITFDLPVADCKIVDRIRPRDWKPEEPANKGTVDGEEEPFKEKIFQVSGDPSELMIRYGKWDESGKTFKYEGAPVGFLTGQGPQTRYLPVMVTYDLLTMYANKVCYDPRTQRLLADGNVIVEDGKQRKRGNHVEVNFSAGNPMTTLITR